MRGSLARPAPVRRLRVRQRAAAGVLTSVLAVTGAAGAKEEIAVSFPSGRVIQAELARTPDELARGLMFRDRLAADRGMLFVFPTADFHRFWMKNCRFPLDIIWLGESGQVVHIETGVPPCTEDPCPTYGPLRKARYVLEVVSGLASKENVRLGDGLRFQISE